MVVGEMKSRPKVYSQERWPLLFRKPVNADDEWHFRPECPWWPEVNYYETVTLQDNDHICKKCIGLQTPAQF